MLGYQKCRSQKLVFKKIGLHQIWGKQMLAYKLRTIKDFETHKLYQQKYGSNKFGSQ